MSVCLTVSCRFSDEFSLLMELQSSQREESSVLTLVNSQHHIQLQLRLSLSSLTFISTQQREYEWVWPNGLYKITNKHNYVSDNYHGNVSVFSQKSSLIINNKLLHTVSPASFTSTRITVRSLRDSQWHQLALSVSPLWLEVYVDCTLVERLNWAYPWQPISTDGMLMVGGSIERTETPFDVSVICLMGWADVTTWWL